MIALEEQGRVQVCVRDGGVRLRRNNGLGLVGNTQSRCLDHGKIIGAIAQRNRIRAAKPVLG